MEKLWSDIFNYYHIRNKIRKILILCLCFFAISSIYADSKKENSNKGSEVINFGEAPWDKIEKIEKFHSRFLVYLSEQLEKKVVLNIMPNYGTLQKDLELGNIQIAAFPPGAYVDALLSIPDKMRYLATIKWHGKHSYLGYLFTLKNNPIDSILKMKGKSIGFTEYGSSSGYKYPLSLFLKEGLEPADFLKIFYLGSHDNVIKGVFNRRVEIGATYDRVYDAFQKKNGNPFKIIKSYRVPFGTFAISTKVSDDLFSKIRKILINFDTKTKFKNGEVVLKEDYYLSGFIIKDNSLYDNLIKTTKLVNEYNKKNEY